MNGKSFDLEIVGREGVRFSEKCDFVVAPTTQGEVGVMAGHIPLMSVISPGRVRIYRKGSLLNEIEVASGFIEITQERVNILADSNGKI